MKRSVSTSTKNTATNSASKMAIVDTFTRLIFGDVSEFNVQEASIIEALRTVEPNVALDGHRAMGDFLRALGVAEMIALVARVEQACGPTSVAAAAGDNPHAAATQQSSLG